jgi:UDP-N-acetylmuramyl pentapeptide synthase
MFGLGEMSCMASDEFGAAGSCHQDIDDMAESILSQIRQEVNLLVKGSRSAGMERLVNRLVHANPPANPSGDTNAI